MRNLCELFEFLSNCDKGTLLNEVTDHCHRIIQ